MLANRVSKLVFEIPYVPCWSTNRPLTPAHCCIHSQTSMATGPSWKPNVLARTPTYSWLRVACVGAFGSATAFGLSRKLQPARAARDSAAAALVHVRIDGFLGSG